MTNKIRIANRNQTSGRLAPLVVAGLALVAAGGAIVAFSLPKGDAQDTPVELPSGVGIDPQLDQPIPLDLELLDELGQTVRLGDLLENKPVILSLVYFECPMLCNLSMDGLVRSMRTLSQTAGEDFTVITVSFDPREGPALAAAAKKTALSRYGRKGDRIAWHFLTDRGDAAKQLADAVGFHYVYDDKSAQYVHAAGIFVLTPEGKLSRFLSGVEYAPRDVKLALSEASEGKSGTLADEILLLCFHYDPTQGKYGLAIFRLLRLGGVVMVVVLGASIYLMSRRVQVERGKEAAADDR